MIITCQKCSTSYNLDESLLKPEGTRVRCSVCSNNFKAFPPVEFMPVTVLEAPDFALPKPHTRIFETEGDDSNMFAQSDDPSGSDARESADQDGMLAYLELDEKSLGIDDIINEIIFIPKNPEDFEPEPVSKSELVTDAPFLKQDKPEETRPVSAEPEGDSAGEYTDLDLFGDDELDFDSDPDQSGDVSAPEDFFVDEDPPAEEDIPEETDIPVEEDAIPSQETDIPEEGDIFEEPDLLDIPDQVDELEDIETEFSPEDFDELAPEPEENDVLEMDESTLDFEDSGTDMETGENDFQFDENETLTLESDEMSDEGIDFEFDVEEEENLDPPDFEEDSTAIESDDSFEFDTDGELTLIDEEPYDDAGLSFDEDVPEEESDDLIVPGEETADLSDTDDDSGHDEIEGAFELEFDVDPDLGLDNEAQEPDYLLQDISEENDDTLEILEIESENDGDAFLEDFSEEARLEEDKDATEPEDQSELFIEDSGKPVRDLTKAGIHSPIPRPLSPEHIGKVRSSKKGGSKIISFFLFVVFLAVILLLVYSAGVMTRTKIPYISDLNITWLDQYLTPQTSKPEPVRVLPSEQTISGSFVANEVAGTLFVITGKVINESSIPVSHVKVKGTLIAEGNIRVKEMTVSSGNILTKEQLEKGGVEDMNLILARKEGENNANVRIKPYGSVEFMIVFSGLPELLKTFEVEVVEFDRNSPSKQN